MNSSKLKDIYDFAVEKWGKIIIQKILLGQNFCASGHNLTNFEKYLPLYNKIKIITLIAPVEKSFCWFLVAVTPLFLSYPRVVSLLPGRKRFRGLGCPPCLKDQISRSLSPAYFSSFPNLSPFCPWS